MEKIWYNRKGDKMSLYNDTKYIMNKYNISASKRLGQNFLIDDEILQEIVDCSDITKDDLVIEIGPGLGTLTGALLEKAGKVICIELDTRMIAILKDRFSMYDNLEIINDDILKMDLNKLRTQGDRTQGDRNLVLQKHKVPVPLCSAKIVANLPYYITTPIIMKLLAENVGAAWHAARVAYHATHTVYHSNGTERSCR